MKQTDLEQWVEKAVRSERNKFPHTFIDGKILNSQQEVVDLLADAATVLDKDRRNNSKNLAKRIEQMLHSLNSMPGTEHRHSIEDGKPDSN